MHVKVLASESLSENRQADRAGGLGWGGGGFLQTPPIFMERLNVMLVDDDYRLKFK